MSSFNIKKAHATARSCIHVVSCTKLITALSWVGMQSPVHAQAVKQSNPLTTPQATSQSTPQSTTQSTPQATDPANRQNIPSFDAITIEGQSTMEFAPWRSSTTRLDLDGLQIQNWNDLGRRAEPGVSFNESSQSINVRGLDKNRVLTRIDGIRQTWLNDVARGVRGGLNTVDFNTLSSIDIVRGADSSAAGSGALGGVVDIKSLNPADLLVNGRDFGSLLKAGYSSVDRSWVSSAAIASQIAPQTQLLLQAGIQSGHEQSNMGRMDGYGQGRTQPDPDNYLQQNYQLKLLQKFEQGHSLGLSGSFFDRQDNIQNLSAPSEIYLKDSSQLANTTRRQSIVLDHGWKADNPRAVFDTVDTQIYWQRVQLANQFESFRRYAPVGDFSRNNSLSDSAYGVQSSVSKVLAGDISQLWKAGGEWYGNTTEQDSSGQDNCPVNFSRYSPCRFLRSNQADMPRVQGAQVGLWLENTFGFAQDAVRLTPGIRYDYFQQRPVASDRFLNDRLTGVLISPLTSPQISPMLSAGVLPLTPSLPPSSSGSAISPKLHTEWALEKRVQLFAQYAFGFNAPSPTQLYSRYGAPGTYLITGNPDLKPETSRGWEFGTKLGDDHLNGALTYFDNQYQNFIESVSRPGNAIYPYYIQTFENLDQVRIYGVEAKASWKFAKGWRAFGSLAWSVGTNQHTNQSLNSVAPLTAITGLAFSQEQWGVQAQVTATAARRDVAFPETNAQVKYADFQAPGFGIADLTAYWMPAHVQGLKLQAGIYNIFNQTYWNALNVPSAGAVAIPRGVDLYTSSGRNIQLTMTYQY